MRRTLSFFSLCLAFILSACMGSGQETETDDLFMDYKIWGEEGNDSVMIMLQFREEGPTGPTVKIQPPGSVSLDGKLLQMDSSAMTGAFYAVSRPIDQFSGRHKIIFIGSDQKKYEEEFSFAPFTLQTLAGDTLTRDKTILQFSGLDKKDYVRVLLTDTSYPGEGIDRLDTVWNNKLVLSKGSLSYLQSGPVFLELIHEQERPVKKRTPTGGIISVFYTIRREFWLKD